MKCARPVCFLGVVLCLYATASIAQSYGGVLRIAVIGEPPHLDQHLVTSDLVDTIAQHVFETLFAFDANWEPKPLLLESYEVSDDGKVWTFHLRRGVFFHNGKEMTQEDVVASLKRYIEFGYRGGLIKSRLESIVDLDKYTVQLRLTEPYGVLPALLSLHAMVVPKEVAEMAGNKPLAVENYIGTGPYKFVEWRPQQYIRLVRFDKYSSPSGPLSGYVGNRIPYLDELVFIPVPEATVRVAGLLSGEYDFALYVPTELYESLKANPSVKVYLVEPPSAAPIYFNLAKGLMANVWMRQAVLAALDVEELLQAAYAPSFWQANPSILPQGTIWYIEEAPFLYNQANPQEAMRLAKLAGYNGEPIRIICTTEYQDHYLRAMALREQLVRCGFTVDLQVYDWATLLARRANPDLWDIFISNHTFYPDPALYTILDPRYVTHWDTPEKAFLLNKFETTIDLQDRVRIWRYLHTLLWIELPWIKLGDFWAFYATSASVKGFDDPEHPMITRPYFWNVWLERQ